MSFYKTPRCCGCGKRTTNWINEGSTYYVMCPSCMKTYERGRKAGIDEVKVKQFDQMDKIRDLEGRLKALETQVKSLEPKKPEPEARVEANVKIIGRQKVEE